MGLDTSLFIVLKEMSQDLRWTLFGVLLWKMLVGPENLLLVLDRLKKSKQGCVDLYNGTSRQTSKAITPSRLGHSFFSFPHPVFLSMQAGIFCGKATKHDLALPRRLIILLQVCCCVQRHIRNPEPEVGVRTEHAGKKNNKNLSMHTESISVARSRLRVASVLFSHDLRWAWL